MKPTVILVALSLLIVPSAQAQYANPYGVAAGTRVRVIAPPVSDRPLVGGLVTAAGDSMVLALHSGAIVSRFPLAAVQEVAVSDGRDRAGSALKYAGIGAGVGAVVMSVTLGQHDPLAGLAGFFAGVIVGGPLGGAVGGILAPERWRDVTPERPAEAVPTTTSRTDRVRLAIEPGTLVRTAMRTSPDRLMPGSVDGTSGDSLFLRGRGIDGANRVALSDLARLEVRGGKDRRRGVLYGAAGLGIVTGVAGGIDYARNNISAGDFVGTWIGNIVLGGLLGYALSPVGWERIPIPGR